MQEHKFERAKGLLEKIIANGPENWLTAPACT